MIYGPQDLITVVVERYPLETLSDSPGYLHTASQLLVGDPAKCAASMALLCLEPGVREFPTR